MLGPCTSKALFIESIVNQSESKSCRDRVFLDWTISVHMMSIFASEKKSLWNMILLARRFCLGNQHLIMA